MKRLTGAIFTLLCLLAAIAVLADTRGASSGGSLFGAGGGKSRNAVNSAVATKPVVTTVPTAVKGRASGIKSPVHRQTVHAKPVKADTARYLNLTRRFGWYHGIGKPITAAQTAYVPKHFVLTAPDGKGHYTKVECVDAYGVPVPPDNIYDMIWLDDKSGSETWVPMLKEVTTWHVNGDNTGHAIVRESGYNADGNLVYMYLPVLINDSTFVGRYTDAFGEPIPINRENEMGREYGMGIAAKIIIDRNGYERAVTLLGADKLPRRNSNGVYTVRLDYDSLGNRTARLSAMMNGKPIYDDLSNCGYIAQYNEYGQPLRVTYVNDEMKPRRMSVDDNIVNTTNDVICTIYEYDSLRLVREHYENPYGSIPDTTSYGKHGVRYKYTPRGKLTEKTVYGLDGSQVNLPQGYSTIRMEYGSSGDLTSRQWYKADGTRANVQQSADGSMPPVAMIKNGKEYFTTDGTDLEPWILENETDGAHVAINRFLNHKEVTKKDAKGRQVSLAYFDKDDRPLAVDSLYRLETRYSRSGNVDVTDETFYRMSDTTRVVTRVDKARATKEVKRYDTDGNLISSFGQTLSPDLEDITGQYGFDALGNPGRTHLESVLYYRAKSGTTYRGATSYIAGVNEYGERSYIVEGQGTGSRIYCMKIFDANDKPVYLDEDDREITDFNKLTKSRKRGFIIELTDKKAYNLGLRTGDILVRYDDYTYHTADKDIFATADSFQIATLVSHDRPKTVKVLRYDERLKRHKPVTVTLPKGMPADLGFICHMLPLTDTEAQRYDRLVAEMDLASNDAFRNRLNSVEYGANVGVVLVRPYTVANTQYDAYRQGFDKDCVMIGACDLSTGRLVRLSDGVDKLVGFLGNCPKRWLMYYTVDGENLKTITVSSNQFAAYYTSNWLPGDIAAPLRELSNKIEAVSVPSDDDSRKSAKTRSGNGVDTKLKKMVKNIKVAK